MKSVKSIIIILFVTALHPSFISYCVAASYQLPNVLVSSGTKVETNGFVYYGNGVGQEAIINYDINKDLLGYMSGLLLNSPSSPVNPGCYGGFNTSRCYQLTNTTSIKLLTSRTTLNGNNNIVSEVAAILYPDQAVIGDVYGIDTGNFALYGRNLKENSSAVSGETWKTEGYTLNPQAQASYTADQKTYFDTHYNQLFGEATKVDNIDSINWGLQNEGMVRTGGSISSQYPEGAVWKNADSLSPKVNLTLNNSHPFLGKGTIIINGNLTVSNGVNIQKASGSDLNTLGLIVLGNVTLEGNNDIQAAIFSTGNIKIGNNVNMTGSFVAQNFCSAAGGSCPSLNNSYGIRISYDYRLEDNWPPGFRYFNMPSAENAAP